MQDLAYDYMNWPRIEALVYAEEQSPRDVMAPKITKDGVLVQGFFPGADSASVLAKGKEYAAVREDDAGYFAVMLPYRKVPEYIWAVTRGEKTDTFADPYAFACQITEEEEKAFLAGTWYDAYKKLGSHPMVIDGVPGTLFAVWAPNAVRVSLVGDFNNWDGHALPMHRMPMTGIYELFVPGIAAGTLYKYELLLKGDVLSLKADPYARKAEKPQGDASVVAPADDFAWTDDAWMKNRTKKASFNVPCSICDASLASWQDHDALIAFLKDEKYTHVELHPIMEYMDDGSDGYPSSALFAVSSRYGEPEDIKKLVDSLHKNGIGVFLDWNAAQFPRGDAGLALFDGTPLYEPADAKAAFHPLWNTLLYNYGSPIVCDYLLSNACFWAEEFHVDGLRLDDVDAMLYLDYGKKAGDYTPNIYGTNENLEAIEFLKHFNSIIHNKFPGFITIAQEDGLWPELTGSVEEDYIGFDYKWSGGWTSDLLAYLQTDAILRSSCHDQLTLSMLYAYCEHFILTLGSRDVGDLHGFLDKVWGNDTQKMAEVRAAYSYMYMHPGWKMAAPSPDTPEELRRLFVTLNELYTSHRALYALDDSYDGFEWIQLMKYDENVISFLRKTEKPEEDLLVICNFSAVSYPAYQAGVPFYGKYKEIFNSDDAAFGGTGLINARAKTSLQKEYDERDCSIKVKLPALSVCVFSCTPAEPPVKKEEKQVKKPAKKAASKSKAGSTAKTAAKPKAASTAKAAAKSKAGLTAKTAAKPKASAK